MHKMQKPRIRARRSVNNRHAPSKLAKNPELAAPPGMSVKPVGRKIVSPAAVRIVNSCRYSGRDVYTEVMVH